MSWAARPPLSPICHACRAPGPRLRSAFDMPLPLLHCRESKRRPRKPPLLYRQLTTPFPTASCLWCGRRLVRRPPRGEGGRARLYSELNGRMDRLEGRRDGILGVTRAQGERPSRMGGASPESRAQRRSDAACPRRIGGPAPAGPDGAPRSVGSRLGFVEVRLLSFGDSLQPDSAACRAAIERRVVTDCGGRSTNIPVKPDDRRSIRETRITVCDVPEYLAFAAG